MWKKCVVAIAVLMIFPAIAKAQDIFWSFSPTELVTFASYSPDETGSAYIFSDSDFGFGVLELQLSNTNLDLVSFSGGEAFNPTFNFIGGQRFDTSEITFADDGSSGRLFLENITQNGVNPPVNEIFDPGYEAGVGPFGAILLARVDFELVGEGESNLEFVLGTRGAVEFSNMLNPSFGFATASVLFDAVPVCAGPNPFNLGDLNYDGVANFLDIAPFIRALTTGEYVFRADCNEDGSVNFLDIGPFIDLL